MCDAFKGEAKLIRPARNEALRGAVPLSHFFLRQKVQPGDCVVDATCGNGLDTLILAQLVGEHGKVWAFDLQPAAVAATAALLEREGVRSRVELVAGRHETLAEVVSPGIKAAVFNLGYLPGGDASLVTRPETTVAALQQALELLVPGGVITISVYTGHPGGSEEADAVAAWCASLNPKQYNAWCSRQLNRPEYAPYLIVVESN